MNETRVQVSFGCNTFSDVKWYDGVTVETVVDGIMAYLNEFDVPFNFEGVVSVNDVPTHMIHVLPAGNTSMIMVCEVPAPVSTWPDQAFLDAIPKTGTNDVPLTITVEFIDGESIYGQPVYSVNPNGSKTVSGKYTGDFTSAEWASPNCSGELSCNQGNWSCFLTDVGVYLQPYTFKLTDAKGNTAAVTYQINLKGDTTQVLSRVSWVITQPDEDITYFSSHYLRNDAGQEFECLTSSGKFLEFYNIPVGHYQLYIYGKTDNDVTYKWDYSYALTQEGEQGTVALVQE